MGEPAFKIKNLLEKNNVNVYSTNFSFCMEICLKGS